MTAKGAKVPVCFRSADDCFAHGYQTFRAARLYFGSGPEAVCGFGNYSSRKIKMLDTHG